jgi:hypothetical protein
MPVIGFLLAQSADDYKNATVAFLQSLKETGYVEGQNVAVEYRYAENQFDRLAARTLGLQLVVANASTDSDIEPAFATFSQYLETAGRGGISRDFSWVGGCGGCGVVHGQRAFLQRLPALIGGAGRAFSKPFARGTSGNG